MEASGQVRLLEPMRKIEDEEEEEEHILISEHH